MIRPGKSVKIPAPKSANRIKERTVAAWVFASPRRAARHAVATETRDTKLKTWIWMGRLAASKGARVYLD